MKKKREAAVRAGTEVTSRDLDAGQSQTVTIKDDYVLVTDGDCTVTGVQSYPESGTHVITVRNVGGKR